MKLNSKGTTKLYNCTWEWFNSTDEVRKEGFKYDQIEFTPDDFEGGYCQNGTNYVVLTIEEAFTLKQMVQWVMKSTSLDDINKAFLEQTYNLLNERFEQVVKTNE